MIEIWEFSEDVLSLQHEMDTLKDGKHQWNEDSNHIQHADTVNVEREPSENKTFENAR